LSLHTMRPVPSDNNDGQYFSDLYITPYTPTLSALIGPAGPIHRARTDLTTETGKPFDASFELYGDQRLTLLDIIRSQLPGAEFVFLSACHTAELTDESVADEMLHFAVAMQYCGYRSVVGTMWAMADTDGQNLAENFLNRCSQVEGT
ncbi:hypothetical protein EDB92DRAFT_1807695, partial [Lactarius akahatsu]